MHPIRVSILAMALFSPAASPFAAQEIPKRIPVPTEVLNTTHQLVGPLGVPLGEIVTITVTVSEEPMKGMHDHYVVVSSINGARLPQPKEMPAKLWQWGNVKQLVPGQQLTLRVYQDGGMIGVPPQVMQETVYIQTSAHVFSTWLVVINAVRDGK